MSRGLDRTGAAGPACRRARPIDWPAAQSLARMANFYHELPGAAESLPALVLGLARSLARLVSGSARDFGGAETRAGWRLDCNWRRLFLLALFALRRRDHPSLLAVVSSFACRSLSACRASKRALRVSRPLARPRAQTRRPTRRPLEWPPSLFSRQRRSGQLGQAAQA